MAYVASFAVGRGSLFGAPILLANLLPAVDYGHVETAQAAASLASGLVTLGTAGVIPLLLLRHVQTSSLRAIVTFHLVVAAACCIVAVAARIGGMDVAWQLAALFTAATTLQTLGSTHLRTQGRSDASVILDAGMFVLMALAATIAWFDRSAIPLAWVAGAVLVYAATLFMLYLRIRRTAPSGGRGLDMFRGALSLGVPIVLGNSVSALATTSGRLGMGLLAGPLVTADYAALARACALPIIAHQLCVIASYRKLFELDERQVEQIAARILWLVAAGVVAFMIATPWTGRFLGHAFDSAYARFRLPAMWILAQAVLWSGTALNDLVAARKGVMARMLPASMGYMTLALAIGFTVLSQIGPTLNHFVRVHALLLFLFYLVQSTAMRLNGIKMWRVWLTGAGTYLSLLAIAQLFF